MSSQNFLDNLENLRLVTSVSLEHLQYNFHEFAKSATGAQVRQADKAICCIRALHGQLEKEFIILEYIMGHGVAAMGEGVAAVTPQLKLRAE
jgi:hypothetical protein